MVEISASQPKCREDRRTHASHHGANKVEKAGCAGEFFERDLLGADGKKGSDVADETEAEDKTGKRDVKEIDLNCEIGAIKTTEAEEEKAEHEGF